MDVTVTFEPDGFRADFFPPGGGTGGFSRIQTLGKDTRVAMFLTTRAQCDELIKAACAAKDLMPAPPLTEAGPGVPAAPPPLPCTSRTSHAPHDACGGVNYDTWAPVVPPAGYTPPVTGPAAQLVAGDLPDGAR